MYSAVNCIEDCFILFGEEEHSSVILRWTLLKNVSYRLVGEALFRYTAVDCTEVGFIEIVVEAVFSYNSMYFTEGFFYTGRLGSSLQVHSGILY